MRTVHKAHHAGIAIVPTRSEGDDRTRSVVTLVVTTETKAKANRDSSNEAPFRHPLSTNLAPLALDCPQTDAGNTTEGTRIES